MESLEIVHIHSDKKFARILNYYKNPWFKNRLICFNLKNNMLLNNENDKIETFSTKIYDINKVIEICKTANVVVLYDLNFIKCYIANRLPVSIKIVWRFFGLELYSKMPNSVYSEITKQALIQSSSISKTLMRTSSIGKQLMKYRTTDSHEFEKAIKRIDAFAGLSQLEYSFLKRRWTELPMFLQLPYSNHKIDSKLELIKTNKVIIGNNRSAYNNHLDILNWIKDSKGKEKYLFQLFFNYGVNNNYTKKVRALAEQIDEVRVIENFMPREEFEKEYRTVCAFAMNGYRQMAMGNILVALTSHVKIYLNKKNIIYDWLLSEGFLVYSMEIFIEDIEKSNLKLTEYEVQHNYNNFKRFVNKYSEKKFINSFGGLLNNN